MKRRVMSALLALCLCLTLLPGAAEAAQTATETADFTADNGTAAIALLNQHKIGEADSVWDNDSKTLTLNGINFTTTATTAVKLPTGSTIVLADESANVIVSGDATAAKSGTYNTKIYITAVDALGALTIQGGSAGTGTLSVTSGTHTNTGDAWTYSSAISVDGNLTVQGGHITATGGKAVSADCAFSTGVLMTSNTHNKALSVTGGSLTAIGGESIKTGDETVHDSFSCGINMYRGNVSVTGGGKLTAKCDPSMDGTGLAYGIDILQGDLLVSQGGEVKAGASHGIDISGGGIRLDGGKITATQVKKDERNSGNAISVEKSFNSNHNTEKAGSITVTGGTLTAAGGSVYMYADQPAGTQGVFAVSGGTVTTENLYGATKYDISGGTVQTRRIDGGALTLSNAALTLRVPVFKGGSGKLYAFSALEISKLTVNSGTLDAAWDWGENTPSSVTEEDGELTPLVRILGGSSGSAAFYGGTATFDTGYAGNVVIKAAEILMGDGMTETGAGNTDTVAHTQSDGGTSVVFSAFQQKEITISGITVESKVYDGTAAATLTGGTLSGVAEGDTVALDFSDAKAEFDSKDAGNGKSVTVKGTLKLTGADAHKYALTPSELTGLKADITPCAAFDDATNKNQIIYVGENSFAAPKFTGIGGEEVTGTPRYTLSDGKTEADIPGMLRALKAGEGLYIPYTFTASGNYSGEKTGTITVTAQERPSFGGGSHTSSYPVTVSGQTQNGSVTVDRRSAGRGDTVTITVKPDSGYVLETLTVMDKDGNELKLTDKGSGKYTFTMPGSRVEVKAAFMEDNAVLNFFYDVPNDSFYYEAVKWAVGKNITSGVGDNLFAPDQPCTRAQIVTFLWRAAGSPEPKNVGSFSDVPASAYYAKAVAWAVENGITTGTGDGMFSPDAVCTRAQAVTFLWRYEKAPVASRSNPFADVAADSYYADAVLWAVKEDISKGTTNTTFNPNADCTRAQIVTFLWRCKK